MTWDLEIVQALHASLASLQDGARDEAIEQGDGRAAASWWDAYARLDLPGVGIDERLGGSGGDDGDVVALAVAAGRRALPVPVVEHHLAASLVSRAGDSVSSADLLTLSTAGVPSTVEVRAGRVWGTIDQVPWADWSRRIVVVDESDARLVVIDPADAAVTSRADPAGQRRAVVVADGAPCRVLDLELDPPDVRLTGRLLRAAQMAGAQQEIADLTVRYVRQRQQFGQSVGSFQSVQQHVVHIVQAATSSMHAVERAAQHRDRFEIDAAWLVTVENSATVARAAHQAHGAIGMTREYVLSSYTRRLVAWRWDFGSTRHVAADLAARVLDGEAGLAATMTASATGHQESHV